MKNFKARIHSIETCGTVDGPGLRYVAFFQGCNLRCKYCHNPDTWSITSGKEMTVEELTADVLKYRSYAMFSGGGFTASGGEPLLQAEFLTELFKELKKYRIHTALDTSGHHIHFSRVKELLNYTDLVLLDIKSINPAKYRELTSTDILPTLKLAEYLNERQIPVWIRYVVVPKITDFEEDIAALAKFLRGLKNIERVEVEPFHKMGEYKWAELGLPYTLKDTLPPSAEKMANVKKIFTENGVNLCS
jgi:pyruvate formate lyase activating enzyme